MRYYVIFIILFWFGGLTGQSVISQKVKDLLERESEVDCIILLKEQADVSEAALFKGKVNKGNFVFNRLQTTSNRTQHEILSFLQKEGIDANQLYIVNAIQAVLPADVILKLIENENVEKIIHNSRVKPDFPIMHSDVMSRTIEWGIEFIEADEVWALGIEGEGVVVGGQDTGYEWNHSALIQQYRGYDSDAGTADHNYHWRDAIHSNTDLNVCGYDSPFPCDDFNHGTHTMGTMVGDDGGVNQIGVAPKAKWIGCRNMDNGWGTPTTYLECFEWFLAPTDLNGENPMPGLAPHVINNSWSCPPVEGCDSDSDVLMQIAINNLKAAGVVVVVSNGNSGSSCNTTINPPAKFPESFSVGAINSSGVIANFSSRGPAGSTIKPNVAAPGVSIRSSVTGNNYSSSSGTSMAGPHVAGTVALIISANPLLAGEVSDIEFIIEQSAIHQDATQDCGDLPGTATPNNTYGHGIINAYSAVQMSLNYLSNDLLFFSAKATGIEDNILVEWAFGSDFFANNIHLQGSTDARKWKDLKEVPFPSAHTIYHFDDSFEMTNKKYYRLKWTDTQGQTQYSLIRVVQRELPEVYLYPNPATNAIFVESGKSDTAGFQLFLYDQLGRLVLEKREDAPAQKKSQIDISYLIPGLYIARLTNLDTGWQTYFKITKQ